MNPLGGLLYGGWSGDEAGRESTENQPDPTSSGRENLLQDRPAMHSQDHGLPVFTTQSIHDHLQNGRRHFSLPTEHVQNAKRALDERKARLLDQPVLLSTKGRRRRKTFQSNVGILVIRF